MPQIRAVILDIYGTLLCSRPGTGGDSAWEALQRRHGIAEPLPLLEFEQRCQAYIREDHAAARAAGEPWPEVHWSGIARRSLPGLAALSEEQLDLFLAEHAGLLRTCSPMPGAGEFVQRCRTAGLITASTGCT